MYKHVSGTQEFDKLANKILSQEQYRNLPRVMKALREGSLRGKCLVIPWLWEIKMSDKRLYFIVQEKQALFIRISDKDNQRKLINSIINNKEEWLNVLRKFKHNE